MLSSITMIITAATTSRTVTAFTAATAFIAAIASAVVIHSLYSRHNFTAVCHSLYSRHSLHSRQHGLPRSLQPPRPRNRLPHMRACCAMLQSLNDGSLKVNLSIQELRIGVMAVTTSGVGVNLGLQPRQITILQGPTSVTDIKSAWSRATQCS